MKTRSSLALSRTNYTHNTQHAFSLLAFPVSPFFPSSSFSAAELPLSDTSTQQQHWPPCSGIILVIRNQLITLTVCLPLFFPSSIQPPLLSTQESDQLVFLFIHLLAMARPGDVKPRASGRASIPTPPVKFASDDKFGQLSRNQNGSKKPKKSKGFTGWIISFASRVTIFYLIYAALWTCPSRPFAFDYSAKDARPVCRNLAQAHDQLAPIVTPYLQLAQQKAEPYTRPVIQAAAPWVKRAQKVSRPIYREANKRGRLIWKKRIDPARRRALKKARKQLDPYLHQAQRYHKRNVQPHIDSVHKAVKPYHDIYLRDISPYVDQAYQYSLHSSSVSYAFYMDKVHPHVVHGLKQAYSFLVNHVDPAVRRFYSLYVRPQIERLLEKVYERKAHWLGSDAIKAAQTEMKQAAKEADKQAHQAVKKAVS